MQDYSMLNETHFSDFKSDKELTYSEKLIELKFLNALEVTEVEKLGATEHDYNYFIGNDKTKWDSVVKGYEEFTLKEIYEGVDLRFIEQEKEIQYEFIVAPNIETNEIQLQYGYQKDLRIDKKGNLIIQIGRAHV